MSKLLENRANDLSSIIKFGHGGRDELSGPDLTGKHHQLLGVEAFDLGDGEGVFVVPDGLRHYLLKL